MPEPATAEAAPKDKAFKQPATEAPAEVTGEASVPSTEGAKAENAPARDGKTSVVNATGPFDAFVPMDQEIVDTINVLRPDSPLPPPHTQRHPYHILWFPFTRHTRLYVYPRNTMVSA